MIENEVKSCNNDNINNDNSNKDNNSNKQIFEYTTTNKDNCISSANSLLLLSTLISITIAQDMSINDLNLLATLLQAVGQNLSVIATSKEICESKID